MVTVILRPPPFFFSPFLLSPPLRLFLLFLSLTPALSSPLSIMEGLFFNADHGFLEGIVRGYKASLLTAGNYINLTQCETVEGMNYYTLEILLCAFLYSLCLFRYKTAAVGNWLWHGASEWTFPYIYFCNFRASHGEDGLRVWIYSRPRRRPLGEISRLYHVSLDLYPFLVDEIEIIYEGWFLLYIRLFRCLDTPIWSITLFFWSRGRSMSVILMNYWIAAIHLGNLIPCQRYV